MFNMWPRWDQWNYKSWGARKAATNVEPVVAAGEDPYPYVGGGYYPTEG